MPRRKKPVPMVLNPAAGSKFTEETVLISLTENKLSVEVVGKVGRGKATRYPRKTLLELDASTTDQIKELFVGKTSTTKKATSITSEEGTPTPKKRGRPKKNKEETTVVSEAPKRRGRPKKASSTEEATTPKKRGRPKKVTSENGTSIPKKKRGRPKKQKEVSVSPVVVDQENDDAPNVEEVEVSPLSRRPTPPRRTTPSEVIRDENPWAWDDEV